MLQKSPKKSRSFPTGMFLLVVGAVCLGLAVTAVYSFVTLSRLRVDYLSNRCHEIAVGVDAQARGPGMRNNPAFWQNLFDDRITYYGQPLAFLALLNQSDQVLASSGAVPAEALISPPGFAEVQGAQIYVLDMPVMSPRQASKGMAPQIAGWHLRVGLRTAEANFIRRQAYVHAVVTALAIVTLALLAYYFLRTLDRFLELKAREESERHLKALGTMAATLAHGIRNPLGAMKGLLELALIVASSSTLSAQDLPLPPAEGPAAVSRPISLAEIEKAAILQALERNQGERRATAEELGISLRTLQYRLKEYTCTPG